MSIDSRKPPKPSSTPPTWAIVVAVIPNVPALFIIWFLFLRCGCTYYAPGFTEAKFASLKEGMTAAEVVEVIGPPLARIPNEDGTILWTYSDRNDDTCSFEMRWVYLRSGKVETISNMRWME